MPILPDYDSVSACNIKNDFMCVCVCVCIYIYIYIIYIYIYIYIYIHSCESHSVS